MTVAIDDWNLFGLAHCGDDLSPLQPLRLRYVNNSGLSGGQVERSPENLMSGCVSAVLALCVLPLDNVREPVARVASYLDTARTFSARRPRGKSAGRQFEALGEFVSSQPGIGVWLRFHVFVSPIAFVLNAFALSRAIMTHGAKCQSAKPQVSRG
ncbi:hypothetical protein IT779_33870 [Nocardia sp. NEAU-351]|uniref:Uncharacterized protein n=1 Tax=Nocardia bovistercoris TaxID=2785916 RepID=A0A931IH45_9NOCA|nr:hypothetical protein [Nocardia bovistercoris]MBH0781271.1 hypothetical protein [Nocardia bovistercoris]